MHVDLGNLGEMTRMAKQFVCPWNELQIKDRQSRLGILERANEFRLQGRDHIQNCAKSSGREQ
jgi:hypothetical protein